MVVPPPMAAYSLQLPGPVNQVMFAPPSHSNDIATVMQDGKVAFYKAATGEYELLSYGKVIRFVLSFCLHDLLLKNN